MRPLSPNVLEDGSIPACGWALPAYLEQFHLAGTPLSGGLPTSWSLPASLTTLNLDDCGLSGRLMPTLVGSFVATALSTIKLGSNVLTGSIPASLVNLPTLADFGLELQLNQLAGEHFACSDVLQWK